MMLAMLVAAGSVRAEDVSLPGGAATIAETHGDWMVNCVVRADDAGQKFKFCALVQEQLLPQGQARQRVLRIEMRPEADGLDGTLVLPFGLDLASGVRLQLDDGAQGGAQPFRTCLPVGCLVEIGFTAVMVAALKVGKSLYLDAVADGGAAFKVTVSLAGFASAYARSLELLR